jgi:hypothetical protein
MTIIFTMLSEVGVERLEVFSLGADDVLNH